MAEIRLENLQKRFGDFTAVRASSFTIADGEFFVLLGPSGCGKTTTLRMIAGLELPSSGKMLLDGDDVTFKRASQRDIGFVFQLFALYPHMNVRSNIGFPLKCQGVARREIAARVAEVAKLLRIEHLIDRPVSGLSGGDSQRVALGRAIVRKAKAFMMDEPLGALDAEFRHLMCVELRALHDRIRATTVYVTHDQVEAMAMADPDRGDESWGRRADRGPAGDLRPAAHHARRGLHRQPAHELPALQRQPGARRGVGTTERRDDRRADVAKGAPKGRWRSACVPSTFSWSTTAAFEARYSARSTPVRCRSSRCTPGTAW
jgi:ABC-type nitrate/sulfonate/bicarbonate transport system ATPase subunit